MMISTGLKPIGSFLLLLVGLIFFAADADAVPSFKRQTGMACMACHTSFPELTPFGRAFKLDGYTQSISNKPFEYPPPVAAMAQLSYTDAKGLNTGVAPFNRQDNDRINIPQQASLFYAGKIYGRLGAFAQLTYNGLSNNFNLDNTDIRYARNAAIAGTPLVYGATINNNPTVQDVWNSTPAWGFPYASSAVANRPVAQTLIDGGLAQQVGGASVYGFWNHLLYGEIGAYGTTNSGIPRPLGAGTTPTSIVDGVAPYWRLALQKIWDKQSVSVGTYGLMANIFPAGNTAGPSDRFTDLALDAQYQYIGQKHIFSVQSTWIHERQEWNASFALGNTANASNNLDTFKINANYYYRAQIGTLGGSIRFFTTTGTTDSGLYAPAPATGSNSGSPDSRGYLFEVSYAPIDNIKVSLQYILYDKFNGGGTNYDGFGGNASDNNTLYLVVWLVI